MKKGDRVLYVGDNFLRFKDMVHVIEDVSSSGEVHLQIAEESYVLMNGEVAHTIFIANKKDVRLVK